MKKILSCMLILTLSFNSFSANCYAADNFQNEFRETTVSKKIRQINDNLALLKSKASIKADEKPIEENKNISKEEIKSSETAEKINPEEQKYANKLVRKSFREQQIEKLKKEMQKLENTSDKKYLLTSLTKIICQIAFEVIAYIYIVPSVAYNIINKINNLVCKKYKSEIKNDVRTFIKTVTKTLHPDHFNRIKSFNDVKELYYMAANLYDNYLK